jgi:hypothetical protein
MNKDRKNSYCPKCGAKYISSSICDYCFNLPDWSFPSLKAAIKKVVGSLGDLVVSVPNSNSDRNTDSLQFDYNGGYDNVFSRSLCDDHIEATNGLSLTIVFTENREHTQFKRLEIYPLFNLDDCNETEDCFWTYSMSFGDDYESAAKIATKIFTDCFYVSTLKKLNLTFYDRSPRHFDGREYAAEGTRYTFFGCLYIFVYIVAAIISLLTYAIVTS